MMFFLTMVFQVFKALTTLPNGFTDAAFYKYGQTCVNILGHVLMNGSWHRLPCSGFNILLVLLQGCDCGRHRHCRRVQTPQQDCEVQCAEGHQSSRSQETVPEVLKLFAEEFWILL